MGPFRQEILAFVNKEGPNFRLQQHCPNPFPRVNLLLCPSLCLTALGAPAYDAVEGIRLSVKLDDDVASAGSTDPLDAFALPSPDGHIRKRFPRDEKPQRENSTSHFSRNDSCQDYGSSQSSGGNFQDASRDESKHNENTSLRTEKESSPKPNTPSHATPSPSHNYDNSYSHGDDLDPAENSSRHNENPPRQNERLPDHNETCSQHQGDGLPTSFQPRQPKG
ncbi:uncharacterized protein NECHADRAFT_88855 [Fusarium vanettenii 77-13-4]|uniref:Uncharacterized protein n=1 Tax=Fusarium vanettenii (strain ATCC MYA-4622 / CBS 123669 / FGSC 9596 / NRRL 45880 / 77-13-4) TaxID=660122 RepID=C7ZN39_FUSV7|nr:uncharacterized protein NECHADRAFT_88855 [Fusarium vanettenii 77-13-4]EEU34567.1 predicted protein [Fusarium vanettenii 77-13-4]